jgi:hypothetical protein
MTEITEQIIKLWKDLQDKIFQAALPKNGHE